jgi:sporadic carbohydrate cluster protein (TIGR04323 family)
LKYYGYVTSRKFGEISMPVPAQNSCIREFVHLKNGEYVLPLLESHFHNCFHQLFTLAATIPNDQCIVMYSLKMLPVDDKFKELEIICKRKNLSFAFVLESLQCNFNGNIISRELRNLSIDTYTMKYENLYGLLKTQIQ